MTSPIRGAVLSLIDHLLPSSSVDIVVDSDLDDFGDAGEPDMSINAAALASPQIRDTAEAADVPDLVSVDGDNDSSSPHLTSRFQIDSLSVDRNFLGLNLEEDEVADID